MAGWETRKPSDAEGLFSEFQLGHGGVSSGATQEPTSGRQLTHLHRSKLASSGPSLLVCMGNRVFLPPPIMFLSVSRS